MTSRYRYCARVSCSTRSATANSARISRGLRNGASRLSRSIPKLKVYPGDSESIAVLARGGDVLRRVALPLPRRHGVAEDAFEQRAEGELAVVAVRQDDHACLPLLEADHVVLCAVAMTFFEERRTEARACEKPPSRAVRQS